MGGLGKGQNRGEFTSLVGERLCLKRKPSVSASGEEVDCFNTSLGLVCCFGCFCCLLPLDASPLYNHIIHIITRKVLEPSANQTIPSQCQQSQLVGCKRVKSYIEPNRHDHQPKAVMIRISCMFQV